MKCWICLDEANSGEHRIKKTDLKFLYPEASQQNPIFHRRNGDPKKNIGSVNSKNLKFKNLICKKCNNEITQEYDIAWEKLSHYLHQNWITIKNNGEINLSFVFPFDFKKNMILVQLFFVKMFGCKIKESYAPIDLGIFSKSIVDKKEHPYLYISFRDSDSQYSRSYSAISDIEICKDGKHIIYAHLYYTIGNMTVDMIYCKEQSSIDLNGGLKPSDMKKVILLSRCNYSQSNQF